MKLLLSAVAVGIVLGGVVWGQSEGQVASAVSVGEVGEEVFKPVDILLPEGMTISNRQARLVRHPKDNRWFLSFLPLEGAEDGVSAGAAGPTKEAAVPAPSTDDPLSRPIEVLPGKWLMNMVRFRGEREGESVIFRVWGEVTAYQDRNYILPTRAAAVSIFGLQEGEVPPESRQARGPQMGPMETEVEKPVSASEVAAITRQLRELLLQIPRTRPLVSLDRDDAGMLAGQGSAVGGGDEGPKLPPVPIARASSQQGIWKEGYMVVDRVVRLAYDPEERRWLMQFEADGEGLSEPPVGVLPCRLLEVMEEANLQAGRAHKFRVSGRVTKYAHRNYVLPRKALVVYDGGNLSP